MDRITRFRLCSYLRETFGTWYELIKRDMARNAGHRFSTISECSVLLCCLSDQIFQLKAPYETLNATSCFILVNHVVKRSQRNREWRQTIGETVEVAGRAEVCSNGSHVITPTSFGLFHRCFLTAVPKKLRSEFKSTTFSYITIKNPVKLRYCRLQWNQLNSADWRKPEQINLFFLFSSWHFHNYCFWVSE